MPNPFVYAFTMLGGVTLLLILAITGIAFLGAGNMPVGMALLVLAWIGVGAGVGLICKWIQS